MRKTGITVALAVLVLSSVQPAFAANEADYPRMSGEMNIEVENDSVYNSDDPNNELNDLYLTVDSTIKIHGTEKLSLEANLVFEPVLDPQPAEDRAFEDHGLYLSSLVLQWEDEHFTAFGGKFTPVFGIGWDRAAGAYGADFAEDYEISEQLGAGGSYTYASQSAGEHTLSLSSFWADTSPFSDSTITRRGRTEKPAGGVGNTENFSSFAIAIDGTKVPAFPDFNYHFSYIHQANGETETADQKGVAIAFEYPVTFSEITVTPLIEFVKFSNADGSPDMERRYLTTSLVAEYQNYNLSLAYSNRSTTETGNPDIDDEMFQISAGYSFENGIGVDVGWKTSEEENIDSQTFGIVIGYTIEF